MKRYALGARRDAPHQRTQKDARILLRAVPPSPDEASLEAYEWKPTLDQNNFGSCGGHGTAQLLFVAFGADGAALDWCPSPDDIYKLTRAVDRAATTPKGDTLPRLADTGVAPADIMTAIGQYGIRPMRDTNGRIVRPGQRTSSALGYNTDCDAATVNVEPSLLALEEDALFLVAGEYRIDETAPDAIELIRQTVAHGGTMARGAPVGCAMYVDSAFMNWAPTKGPLDEGQLDLNDPAGGGHWIALTGYRTANDGTTILRFVNSWSEDYGDAGHVEVTDRWLRRAIFDVYPFPVRRSSSNDGNRKAA